MFEQKADALSTVYNTYDFFKIEYEKCLEIIHKLHEMRLSYQKFYVSIAGAIITIAVLVSRFVANDAKIQNVNGSSGFEVLSHSVSYEILLGFIFVISAIVGYFVVRNLISIRRNEVYWTNFAISLRRYIILSVKLPDSYPSLASSDPIDFYSADFQTIVACSFINLFIVLIGSALFMSGAETLHAILFVVPICVVFMYFHISSIRLLKRPLNRGERKGEGVH